MSDDFTQDDVSGLRTLALIRRVEAGRFDPETRDTSGVRAQYIASAEWFDSLADRISARLPSPNR